MFTSGMRAGIMSHAKKRHRQGDQKGRQHSNVRHNIISLLLFLLGALEVKCKTEKWDTYSFSGLTAPCETSHPPAAVLAAPGDECRHC